MNREMIKGNPTIIIDGIIQRRQSSDIYKQMVESDKYYNLQNSEIMSVQKNMVVAQTYREYEDGIEIERHVEYKVKEDQSKSNFKLPHGFHFELVNQCTNFLAGRPIRISWEEYPEDEDKSALDAVLRNKNSWGKFGQQMVTDAQRYGVGYGRVSIDREGDLRFNRVDPKSVSIFTDEYGDLELVTVSRTKLEYMDDGTVQEIEYFDVYDDEYRDTYRLEDGWVPSDEDVPLLTLNTTYGGSTKQVKAHSWGKPPFIVWNGSEEGMTSLQPIKPFIDMIDITISNWANDIEDIQQMIWILKNYQGQDLDEFMSDLKEHKAINVGEDGDVKAERGELPYKARQELHSLLLKSIYRFGRGIDFTDRENLGNITGTGLKWSYELLEEKANEIEINGQDALDDLFRFIYTYLSLKGFSYFDEFVASDINFIFDRSLMINEEENVNTALKFASFGSLETALEHTDWVQDPKQELQRIKEEGGVSDTEVRPIERDSDEEETTETVETIEKPIREDI